MQTPIESDEVQQTRIHCPNCGSDDWFCWDERSFDCWDAQDRYAGTKVGGYLGCKVCNTRWTDNSADPSLDEDCTCEED